MCTFWLELVGRCLRCAHAHLSRDFRPNGACCCDIYSLYSLTFTGNLDAFLCLTGIQIGSSDTIGNTCRHRKVQQRRSITAGGGQNGPVLSYFRFCDGLEQKNQTPNMNPSVGM